MSDYGYFMKINLSPYIGEWVAICDERIVSHDLSFKKAFHEAKEKCPHTKPLLTRVPEKETMIL